MDPVCLPALARIGFLVLPPGLRERLEAAEPGAEAEVEELAKVLGLWVS